MADADFNLLGKVITVKSFPIREGLPVEYQYELGRYFVDSLVFHAWGTVEIGLSAEPEPGQVVDAAFVDDCHFGYFDLQDLEINR